MTPFNILVVNPKDYLTQIAVYQNYKLLYMISRKHSPEELGRFSSIYDQVTFRKDVVIKELKNNDFRMDAEDRYFKGGADKTGSIGGI